MDEPQPVEGNNMLSRILVAALLCSSVLGFSQSIDSAKVATVHVYRQGRLLVTTSLLVDGRKVVSLTPDESTTFYLAPGYHELTLQSGEISPMTSFFAEAGKCYCFRLNYEHVVSPTSIRALSASLTMQPNIPDADDIREVTIEPDKLLEILQKTAPYGLAIQGSTASDANLKVPETQSESRTR